MDPLGLRGSSKLMPFGYAEDNPVRMFDLLGLCSCDDECPSGKWTYVGISAGSALVGGISFGRGTFQCQGSPNITLGTKSTCAVIGFGTWIGVDLTTGVVPAGVGCKKDDLLGLKDGWFAGLGPVSGALGSGNPDPEAGRSGSIGVGASLKIGGGWVRCRVNAR